MYRSFILTVSYIIFLFSVTIVTGGSSVAQELESFTLINADTDQDISAIEDGDTIILEILPTLNLNIRANTNPAEIGSVVFELNGSLFRIESVAPYALAGDSPQGDFHPWTPTPGQYTLTAI